MLNWRKNNLKSGLSDSRFSLSREDTFINDPQIDLSNEIETINEHLKCVEESLENNNWPCNISTSRNQSGTFQPQLYSRNLNSTKFLPKLPSVAKLVLKPTSLVSSDAWTRSNVIQNHFQQSMPPISRVQPFQLQQKNGSSHQTGGLALPSGNLAIRGLEEEESKGCGWINFRPKCLQSVQTAKWVLFWLCWAGAIQGMVVNGFVNVCITTLEKRYHLKSADTGLIAGAYDIASVLCSIPVSYLGSLPGASKPRWLGWGLLLMALGSFTFSLPHFISPMYKEASTSLDGTSELLLCLSKVNVTPHCGAKVENWLSSFRHIFAVGQFLHGVGASPLYTLGITYLDESVPVRTSSIYLGIFYAMAIVGPALGYVIGGKFLNIYIDAPGMIASQLGLTPSSDQWLGAWWIGFLLSGVLAVIISGIVMAFPPEIPGAKMRASQRASEEAHNEMVTQNFENIKDLPKASKNLASNATFVCLSLAGATEGVLLTGFATFMPKFIESQFSVSASNAALLVGFIAVPAGGGGTLIGGWIIKHFHLKCKGVLKVCTILSLLCFLSCLSFVISCPDNHFAGVTVPYLNGSVPSIPNLESTCNSNCACNNVPYDPVCGSNSVLYYSPCHAGCSSVTIVNGKKVFGDCECISQRISIVNVTEDSSSALLKKCPSSCSMMPIFLMVFFFVMLITFIMSMPAVSGTLRCVPDNYRSFALGLQWIVIRIAGTIPGPIIFGVVIDSSCRLWQTSCNIAGSCASYDNIRMSRSLMTLSLVFKAMSTLFFFLAWRFFISPKRREDNNADGVSIATVSTAVTTPL